MLREHFCTHCTGFCFGLAWDVTEIKIHSGFDSIREGVRTELAGHVECPLQVLALR
jgi:hypothetical protein